MSTPAKCPMCGYVDGSHVQRHSNVMSIYVNKEDSDDRVCLNSAEKEMTVGKKIYMREDVAKQVAALEQKTLVPLVASPQAPAKPAELAKPATSPILVSAAPIKATAPAVVLPPSTE